MKYLDLIKHSWRRWRRHNCSQLGAALAYYALFSIAPLLVVAFALAGVVFGNEAPYALNSQLRQLVGPSAAEAVTTIVTASRHHEHLLPTILGVVTMLVGALGMFMALQDDLNTIWEVEADPNATWKDLLSGRVVPFLIVFVTSVALLVSLAASSVIQGASEQVLNTYLPLGAWATEAINNVASFVVLMLLFAVIYRVVPERDIGWSDTWVGAAITALLFVVGKIVLAIYLGRSSYASAYGAAGSLVVLLVWIYYAAQIFLFGAELTRQWAQMHGSPAAPRRRRATPPPGKPLAPKPT